MFVLEAGAAAIMDNASAFKDKVVLDVGTGSGGNCPAASIRCACC